MSTIRADAWVGSITIDDDDRSRQPVLCVRQDDQTIHLTELMAGELAASLADWIARVEERRRGSLGTSWPWG